MPTSVHECPSRFLSTTLFNHVKDWLTSVVPGVELLTVGNPTYTLPIGEKIPDGGFYAFRTRTSPAFPQMILEVGYTQSYRSLLEDARQWLLGSTDVRSVLLVKFLKPKKRDMHRVGRWRAWIEIWERGDNGCVSIQSWRVIIDDFQKYRASRRSCQVFALSRKERAGTDSPRSEFPSRGGSRQWGSISRIWFASVDPGI